MKRLLLVLLLFPAFAAAAQQQCLCTGSAPFGLCKVASDPFTGAGPLPTSCNVYKAGVLIASGPVVLSTTIPILNTTACSPVDVAYVPVAGANACYVALPAQANGTSVTLTMRAVVNGVEQAVDSTPLTFTSVSAFPLPIVPLKPRISN